MPLFIRPTTATNASGRLFLRFFLCYLTGLLLSPPFLTGRIPLSYVGTLLLRSVLTTLLAQLLYPLTRLLYRGRDKAPGGSRSTREVKNF